MVVFQPRHITIHNLPNFFQLQNRLRYQITDGVTVDHHRFSTRDGESINGILFKNPYHTRTIIFSHGNASSIYRMIPLFSMLGKHANILLYEYRGYGLSSGTPTEAGVYRDAYDAWGFVTKEHRLDPKQITLMGESLGSAVTTWLGSRLASEGNPPHSMILVSGFSSLRQLISDGYGMFLAHFHDNAFDSRYHMGLIKDRVKTLVIHSQEDEMIPYHHHQQLLNSHPETEHYPIKGCHSPPEYDAGAIDSINRFLYVEKNE